MLLDTLTNLALNIKTAVDFLCKNINSLFKENNKNQQFKQIIVHLGSLRHPLEQLLNNILYAQNLQVIQNITQTRQVSNLLRQQSKCKENGLI